MVHGVDLVEVLLAEVEPAALLALGVARDVLHLWGPVAMNLFREECLSRLSRLYACPRYQRTSFRCEHA